MRGARWTRGPWVFLFWPMILGTTVVKSATGTTSETSTELLSTADSKSNTETATFTHSSVSRELTTSILKTPRGPNASSTDSIESNASITHSTITSTVSGGTTTSSNSVSFISPSSDSNDMTKTTDKIWSTTAISILTQAIGKETSVHAISNIVSTSGDSTSDDKKETQQASQTHQTQSFKTTEKSQTDSSPSSMPDTVTIGTPSAPSSTPSGQTSTASVSQEKPTSGGISTIVTSKGTSVDQSVSFTSTVIATSLDISTSDSTSLLSVLVPNSISTQETDPYTVSTSQSLPTNSVSVVTNTTTILMPSSPSTHHEHTATGSVSQNLSPSGETAISITSTSSDSHPTQRTTEPLTTAGTSITTQKATGEQIDSGISTADSTSLQTTHLLTSPLDQATSADSQKTKYPITELTLKSQTSHSVSPTTENNEIVTSLSPSFTPTRHPSSENVSQAITTSDETTLTFSKTQQTQSMETIRRSQTSTITRTTTPPSPPSPSVHNPTGSVSQETSSSGGTTDSSLSSFSHTALATSELLTTSISNTGKTSQTVNGSFPSVTSSVSMTTGLEGQSTPSTANPTQETSALSQTLQTLSTETTGRSQASIITRVTTPPVPPSPSEHIPTETVSQKITVSSETTTSAPSSGSHTVPMASSTDMTLGNTGEASLSITTSFPPVTSKVSTSWWSGAQSTPISFSSSNQKTSAVSQTHQREGTEFTRGTLAKSSSSASMSQEIFTPGETTTFPSLSSSDTHTTQSQTKLPPTLTGNTTTVIDIETSSTATTAAILRGSTVVSSIGKTEEPNKQSSLSTSSRETTETVSLTPRTQITKTTEHYHVSNTSSSVTHTIQALTSVTPSSTQTGFISQHSITPGPTRHSTRIVTSTYPKEPSTVSQIGHTHGSHSTQESQTMNSISPMTDNLKTVTIPTSFFKSSGPSPSVPILQDTSEASEAKTLTSAHSRDSHTTQGKTESTSPDTTLVIPEDTAQSITSTPPKATSLVSTSRSTGAQSVSSTSTYPDSTSAIFQSHQTQSIETPGQPHTSRAASTGSESTLEGKTTSSLASASSHPTSGSDSPETVTSGKLTSIPPSSSTNSHTSQLTPKSLSTVPSVVTTAENMRNVSVLVTILPTASEVSTTEGATGQSTPTSSSPSPQETLSVTQMAQTLNTINTRESEIPTSVSQVTDISSTLNGHTSPVSMPHTMSPSGMSTTLTATQVSNSNKTQTTTQTMSVGATEGAAMAKSTTVSIVTPPSPSTIQSTSIEVRATTQTSAIHENITAVIVTTKEGSASNDSTKPTQNSSSSVDMSSTPTREPPATLQTVASTHNPMTRPFTVSSTNTPSTAADTTTTGLRDPTSHPSIRTTFTRVAEERTSQSTTSYTITNMPTSPESSSSNTDKPTELEHSTISHVTTKGNPGDFTATVSSDIPSDSSTTEGPTEQATPISISTSAQQSLGGSHPTQESHTTSLVSSMTDNVRTVTIPTSSFNPSELLSSATVFQDKSVTSEVSTLTPTHSRNSLNTQVTTESSSLYTNLGTSADIAQSTTTTSSQDSPLVSTAGSTGIQSASSSTSTYPDTTSAIFQSHQTQSIDTPGQPHTSRAASPGTDTTLEGMTTSSSASTSSHTASGRSYPETVTSGKLTSFSLSPSNDSRVTQWSTESLSSKPSLVTTPGTIGSVPVLITSTILPTISEVSTTGGSEGQSTPTSSSPSPQDTSAISQMDQSPRTVTTTESETLTSVSQVTDSFSTITHPPLSSTLNGHTSQGSMVLTQSLLSSSPFMSTPVSDSHKTQTASQTTSVGVTDGTARVSSTALSDVTPLLPSIISSTSVKIHTTTPSSAIHENITAVVVPPIGDTASNDSTKPTQTSSSSVDRSSTPTPEPPATLQTLASTENPMTRPNSVTTTNTLTTGVSSNSIVTWDPTSHLSVRSTSATISEARTSRSPTSYTFDHLSTSPESSSSNTDKPTELEHSPTSHVTTKGNPGDFTATVSSATPSDGSTTEGPTEQATPISISTSAQQSLGGSHPTQESHTTSSISSMTDKVRTVTIPTSSFKPSELLSSATVLQDKSVTSEVSTLTPTHSRNSINTQMTTESSSLYTNLGTSADIAQSVTTTNSQDSSLVSTAGSTGIQSASSSTSTYPDTTSAIFQSHQTQSIDTPGQPHTSRAASPGTDTTLEGMTTSSSASTSSHTASGRSYPETVTSGKLTSFSLTPSSDSHVTQWSTESLSSKPSLVTTPGTIGSVPVLVTSTILPTISEVSTTGGSEGQSTPTSSSPSPQDTSAISQMAQSPRTITTTESETLTSVSQVTDSFSTITHPPLSSTLNRYTSQGSVALTQSLSSSSPFMSTPVSDSHKTQTASQTTSVGVTDGTARVSSTALSDVTPLLPSIISSTSVKIHTTTPSSAIHENITAVVVPPIGDTASNDSTKPTQTSSSSVDRSSTPTPEPPATLQTLASTENPMTRPNSVTTTNTLTTGVSSNSIVTWDPTSHLSVRSTSATISEARTSRSPTSYTFDHLSTSPESSSSNTDKPTELEHSPTSHVTTKGNPGDFTATVSSSTPSDGSTTEGPTEQATPISISTSAQQSLGGSHPTQESHTTSTVSPMSDNIQTVITPTSSFKPSELLSSATILESTPATSEVTLTPAHSKNSHTTQMTAESTRPAMTLETSANSAQFIPSTTAQATSPVPTAESTGAHSASSSTSTYPDTTSAIFQSHQTQSIDTPGQPHTSRSTSPGTDTTLEGMTTSSSASTSSHTASGRSYPETVTSGKLTSFSLSPSSDSRVTQWSTESLSSKPSLVTTPGTIGSVPVLVTSTILPTISEVSTTGGSEGQSTPTSSSPSPQDTSAISQMAQSPRTITTTESETLTSVSQVTDSFSTITHPPLSSTLNRYTSQGSVALTQSLSSSSPFMSTPVSDSHKTQTASQTTSVGVTDGTARVSSTALSDVTPLLPSIISSTSVKIHTTTPSSVIHENITAVVVPPIGDTASNDSTKPTQTSSSSVDRSSTPTPEPPATLQTLPSTDNPMTRPNSVTTTNTLTTGVSSNSIVTWDPTSHLSVRSTSATISEARTSRSPTSYTFAHLSTSPESSSSNTDKPTELEHSPTSHVTTKGNPGDFTATVSSATPSDGSTTKGPTEQATPISISTSAQQSLGGSHPTQESHTTSSISSMTNSIRTVTIPTSSFKPSELLSSATVLQDKSVTSEVSTLTPTHSRNSHNTQMTTESSSLYTNLGTSADIAQSITTTNSQDSSLVSTSGSTGAHSASSSTSTYTDTMSAIFQSHQTQSIKTPGQPHTSRAASPGTDTTLEGMTTSSSASTSSHTASRRSYPETVTSGKLTSFSLSPSSDSRVTQWSTESLSSKPSLVTTPGTIRSVPVLVTSTILPTITEVSTTGRSEGQSTPTASSPSSQEISAISQMAQSPRTITTTESETLTSVSQVNDIFSTITHPPLSSTLNRHTSQGSVALTQSLSSSSPFMSTPVRDSHKTQTASQTMSVGVTDGTARVSSTALSDVTPLSPSIISSTSVEVHTTSPSSVIHENITAVVVPPIGDTASNDSTKPTQTSSSSVDRSSTPTPEPPATLQTLASTDNPMTRPSSVTSTNTLNTGVSSNSIVTWDPTSHLSVRSTSATISEARTSRSPTSSTFAHLSTSPESSSSHTDKPTELEHYTISHVTTKGNPGDFTATVNSATPSDSSTTEVPTEQATPISISTSAQQSLGGSHPTQEFHTTSSVSPMTDNVRTVTIPTSSFKPSELLSSATVLQDKSVTSEVSTLTPTHSRNSHNTQMTAESSSLYTNLGTSADIAQSVTTTNSQDSSLVSTSGSSGIQSASSSTSTYPDTTSAIFPGHQTQSIETPGQPHTSRAASPATDTTLEGRTTSSLTSTSSYTASGSDSSGTVTSGITTISSRTNSDRSTATTLPNTAFQTLTTSTASTPIVTHSSPPVPIKPDKGVSLFPYGLSVQDQKFVKRIVDFTSPLFKPKIGFPFGSSLRDFLYFTDNGQIIFPESDNQVFSYPNPPSRGFTGWESVALVAPFWDDADFSSHRGNIFYQEYKTFYDEYNPLVRQVESWIEKLANTWYYKARWTLKVTWVNVPAYPAHWTSGTNTYQAILSTDGSKSYALFLYQSGGMRWDAAQRPGNSVLMGFSSGDGYFQNSPLTSRPVWEKYRPDQFLNFSSGLRGLQIYTLHREERPNYRLKCLQWLKRQPQRPSWGWHQISCPCSWQQGQWDLRFQPTNTGWWGSSRQLCSFSSWRGGVCCSYGPWGEFLEGWRVPSPWQFDQELESKNWCCRWNDKPFFCTLYKQRQPRISCAGYRPTRPAWMFGDPHITTFDGANYTFNGLGDFLLVRAKNKNSSFLLQGRTAQTGMAKATNFIAFAAQYNSISLEPITVQWLLESNDKIHVQLNNKTVTFEANSKDADGQEIFNTTGIILIHNGSMVSANFDGTVTISVIAASNILHASSSLPEEYQNHTEGLLGVWNDNPNDDFQMSNGTTLPRESSEEMIFHYGMTWEINGTSLLGNRNDQLPSNFTPIFFKQLINTSFDQNLISHCNEDTQCIFDTLATLNITTGLSTKVLFRRFQEINATLNQYPPSVEGEPMLTAYKGQTKLFQYSSKSENTIFSLRNNSTDFILLENGTLLWTPKSLEPFTLEILAKNVKNGLTSEFRPATVACFCSAESQCLYNMTSRVGNSSLEVANCKCDGDTFGHQCERSRNPCEECFPTVNCTPGKGCEACPPHLTGDGRHCAALENAFLCENKSCPVNYCYNHGHCYISPTPDCQPTCTCPPAFTDTRCFLAGNNFTPSVSSELPLRIIQLLLSEEENASVAEVNASVAYRLGTLDVRAFFRNSQVEASKSPAPASGSSLHRWTVISEFQYRPGGPVIDFLNNRLLDAVVEAFLPQAPRKGWSRSAGPRHNVSFHPISRREVHNLKYANVSTLENHFQCNGYKGYHLVYTPQRGFTCVSPCSEGYCKHGGQCQHLPEGLHCRCVPFSIYTSWGEHCEHLSLKLGAFFGILFGALGALLLLGVVTFVVLRFCNYSKTWDSYPLDSEN